MVIGGRIEVTIVFDNIFEAAGWVEREYRGFKKTALLIFKFNEDLTKASKAFHNSFTISDRLYIPVDIVEPKRFLDEAYDIVETVKYFGGIITEVKINAAKEANGVNELDGLFNDVRREIELWNFSRAMDSLPKAKV